MRFKRIFSALCIAFLLVFQCVPVYALTYTETVQFHYVAEDGDLCRIYTVDDATNTKNKVILYETPEHLYVVRKTEDLNWCVKGLYKSWYTSSVAPVYLCPGFSGVPLTKGKNFGGITWGVEGFYSAGISKVEEGVNPRIDYYANLTDLEAENGADFFRYTPTIYRNIMMGVPGVLEQTKTVSVLVRCGICLMALLIGLVVFGKVFKIFQI